MPPSISGRAHSAFIYNGFNSLLLAADLTKIDSLASLLIRFAEIQIASRVGLNRGGSTPIFPARSKETIADSASANTRGNQISSVVDNLTADIY